MTRFQRLELALAVVKLETAIDRLDHAAKYAERGTPTHDLITALWDKTTEAHNLIVTALS